MIWDLGFGISDCRSRAAAQQRFSLIRNPQSPLRNRRCLTLIELLVVITILTVLVVGVIPLFSANHDGTKIRDAARGLQTYVRLAQSKAAQSGRPCGIAFVENGPNSNVALKVFQIEVPTPFAGFSTESRVAVAETTVAPSRYGDVPEGNDGERFRPYRGLPLYQLSFTLGGDPAKPDPFPPRMLQIGDQIEIAGNVFLLVDDGDDAAQPNQIESLDGTEFVVPDTSAAPTPTVCVWLNHTGQVTPAGARTYQVVRQPANSAERPYQLPAGVAIDIQASGTEGGAVPTHFGSAIDLKPLRIMFSPDGSVEGIFFNGTAVGPKIVDAARVYLLLGRVENGGVDGTPWALEPDASDEVLREKQARLNWLNPDSRWIAISGRNGRVVAAENALVDTRTLADLNGNDIPGHYDALDQLTAARVFARNMQRGGVR